MEQRLGVAVPRPAEELGRRRLLDDAPGMEAYGQFGRYDAGDGNDYQSGMRGGIFKQAAINSSGCTSAVPSAMEG